MDEEMRSGPARTEEDVPLSTLSRSSLAGAASGGGPDGGGGAPAACGGGGGPERP